MSENVLGNLECLCCIYLVTVGMAWNHRTCKHPTPSLESYDKFQANPCHLFVDADYRKSIINIPEPN